jgi:hypothetical protein
VETGPSLRSSQVLILVLILVRSLVLILVRSLERGRETRRREPGVRWKRRGRGDWRGQQRGGPKPPRPQEWEWTLGG